MRARKAWATVLENILIFIFRSFKWVRTTRFTVVNTSWLKWVSNVFGKLILARSLVLLLRISKKLPLEDKARIENKKRIQKKTVCDTGSDLLISVRYRRVFPATFFSMCVNYKLLLAKSPKTLVFACHARRLTRSRWSTMCTPSRAWSICAIIWNGRN